MKILAFELSTRRASVALLEEDRLLAEHSWEEPQAHQKLFEVLPEILKSAGVRVGEIDVFAAGRGPGAFSGIRVALTAAQSLALPSGKKVFAVSSGEALARAILRETQAPEVAVVGDARRDTLWYGAFDCNRQTVPWTLTTLNELSRSLPNGAVRVSPDWDRLASKLGDTQHWIRGNRYPSARDVADIVMLRMKGGMPSEPMEPLYMHPPV